MVRTGSRWTWVCLTNRNRPTVHVEWLMMKLLIIGGTRFVGRHLAAAALARGHQVTLFHRGQTNSDLFPAIEHLHGDRDGDLAMLKKRRWNAVIDTCGYVPRVVRQSVEVLANAADQYVFISTISVYRDDNPMGMNEDSPLATLADETTETVTDETYGALKVMCEKTVAQAFANRALIIRPGVIVGPHDYTDRFTYWVHRVTRGGEVLAPGNPDQPVQFIDARDLGEWCVHMVEARRTGVFNATGPDEAVSMRQLLDECQAVCNQAAHFTWIDEQFLLDAGAQPWSELPLWVPAQSVNFQSIDCRRAIAAGLTYRPLATTIRDTLDWDTTRPSDHEWRAGLTTEREQELLHNWRTASS